MFAEHAKKRLQDGYFKAVSLSEYDVFVEWIKSLGFDSEDEFEQDTGYSYEDLADAYTILSDKVYKKKSNERTYKKVQKLFVNFMHNQIISDRLVMEIKSNGNYRVNVEDFYDI